MVMILGIWVEYCKFLSNRIGASKQDIGREHGGPVKLDSMWQHRLTRPLHVQHTYPYNFQTKSI